jgi:excisionase family DNA binding protein
MVEEKKAKRLYKVPEVAEMLCVSRAMIYRLMDKGQLEYVRINCCRRVSAEAIEKLIQEGTVRR